MPGWKNNRQIKRDDGKEIYNPEKTEKVFEWFGMAVNSEKIFYCKNYCEEHFKCMKQRVISNANAGYTFQANGNYTQNYKPEKKYVKYPSLFCMRAKNYDKKLST